MKTRPAFTTAALVALGVISAVAFIPVWAQEAQKGTAKVSANEAFDPASLADQQLGRRFMVKPDDLPPPRTGPMVANGPLTIPYQGQTPRVPEGFTVTAFATGLENPRRLLVLPNGDVIVAEQKPGYLTLLRDADNDGKAE
jgi:glucose/arabinose dehydrogenase